MFTRSSKEATRESHNRKGLLKSIFNKNKLTCPLYHPNICRNSRLNRSCNVIHYHLVGTHHPRPQHDNHYNHMSENYNQTNQVYNYDYNQNHHDSSNPNNGELNQQPNSNFQHSNHYSQRNNQQSLNEAALPFLDDIKSLQMQEQEKQFQQELIQMKTQIQPTINQQ